MNHDILAAKEAAQRYKEANTMQVLLIGGPFHGQTRFVTYGYRIAVQPSPTNPDGTGRFGEKLEPSIYNGRNVVGNDGKLYRVAVHAGATCDERDQVYGLIETAELRPLSGAALTTVSSFEASL